MVDEVEYIDDSDEVLKDELTHRITAVNIEEKNYEDRYETNTKNFNPIDLIIESPEETALKRRASLNENPNMEFIDAIRMVENNLDRKLNKEEYIAACDSYATILAERDEEKKANFSGKYDINPIKKEKYKEMLLNNRPVTNVAKEIFEIYEKSMIKPIIDAYKDTVENEPKVIEIKRKDRVNTHYKGKCRIASDEGGKVIVIDHKKDIDLLRMKYRQEWIETKYPKVKDMGVDRMYRDEEDDEFV
jgi:hypothetical protein